MLGRGEGKRGGKHGAEKRKGSFIPDPQSVDQSVRSQIRGLCQPSGGSRQCGCKAQPSKTHGSGPWLHAGNKMLQTGFGYGCESPELQLVTNVSLSSFLTRPSFCFFHCVLTYRQFLFNGSVFISFCLWYTLAPCSWATLSERNPNSNSKFIWVRSVCPFVAAEEVSALSVFSSACVKVLCHEISGQTQQREIKQNHCQNFIFTITQFGISLPTSSVI